MTLEALRRGDLAGARAIRLTGGLRDFPPELFGLADTLELLDLGGNALTDLPPDMGRFSRLSVLFCSGNRIARLPPSLGDCRALTQIGFRNTGLTEIPAEALPAGLRWLTVTDNALDRLPEELGRRPFLQKLMLAGNQLKALPESLGEARNLELLRLSANRLEALPPWLLALPRLAWLACAGNPFDRPLPPSSATFRWSALTPGPLLGEGASGVVHQALWQPPGEGAARPVAVKLFRGRMTSDGLPDQEMAACLAAGTHPNLAAAMGHLTGHPEGLQGLVMPLLPAHWRPLAGPPSLKTCSRDVYDATLRLPPVVVQRLAWGTAAAAAHLHAGGLLHGDLYAHNILWDGMAGDCVLTDFGAAAPLPDGPGGLGIQRIEVLAWGILLGELLDHSSDAPPELRALQQQCVNPDPAARPLMAEVVATLR